MKINKIPYKGREHLGLGRYKYTDIFCTNCFRHEDYFTGGGSWSPDLCPCGCEDTISWYKMTWLQRRKAVLKYRECERIRNFYTQ